MSRRMSSSTEEEDDILSITEEFVHVGEQSGSSFFSSPSTTRGGVEESVLLHRFEEEAEILSVTEKGKLLDVKEDTTHP